MKKLIITTALAAVLAGGAYAQGHHGGGGGGGMGGGGGGMGGGMGGGGHASMGGGWGSGPSMMSHGPSGGPSGPSSFSRSSSLNGPSSQFSRNNRTLFNQERGNRLFNRVDRDDRMRRDIEHDRFSRIGHDRGHDNDFRHRGIVRGDFFEHGRHFHFRRFFHGQFVFLVGFDDCTAWAWVNVAPGVWAWRPINVCIG